MANYQEMSMLDVATSILEKNQGKMKMSDLLRETIAAKELDSTDYDLQTQLYLDITTSARFVYMGEEEWDLKDRQPLAMFDKDGSEFNVDVEDEFEKEEDDLTFEDDDSDDYDNDDEEDYDDEEVDEDDYDDDDLEHDENGEILERYHEDDDFDEDKYNNYMDDFEDMYDDN